MKKLILFAILFVALSSCKERRYNPNEEQIKKSSYIAYGFYEEGEIEVVETKTINGVGRFAIIKVGDERFLVDSDGFIQPLKKSSK